MAFKMKTIPELLGFNAEHSERKSIVFETKMPKYLGHGRYERSYKYKQRS